MGQLPKDKLEFSNLVDQYSTKSKGLFLDCSGVLVNELYPEALKSKFLIIPRSVLSASFILGLPVNDVWGSPTKSSKKLYWKPVQGCKGIVSREVV